MRALILLVLLLACAAWVPANAATGPQCNASGAPGNTHYCTQQLALAACIVRRDELRGGNPQWNPIDCRLANPPTSYALEYPGWQSYGFYLFAAEQPCSESQVRNPFTGQCQDNCSARNSQLGGTNTTGKWFAIGDPTTTCVAGCKFVHGEVLQTDSAKVCHDGTCTSVAYRELRLAEYSGDMCGSGDGGIPPLPPEDTKPKEQECTAAGSGQSYCLKKDGKRCYTASTGKQICWSQGETGEKGDGNTLQVRKPGPNVPTPKKPATETGDTYVKQGDAVQTTSTKNGNTTTVTTQNYTTEHGTNADNPGYGEDDGEEDGEETGGASSDCEAMPQCSSLDSIGCAMLRQTWTNHCSLVKDIANSPGEGDHAAAAEGAIGGVVNEFSPDRLWDESESASIPGLSEVDQGGIASRGNCPVVLQFSAFHRSYTMDGKYLCQLLDALAMLIGFLAIYHPGLILVGGRK